MSPKDKFINLREDEETRSRWNQQASLRGMSLADYIRFAISEQMLRDATEGSLEEIAPSLTAPGSESPAVESPDAEVALGRVDPERDVPGDGLEAVSSSDQEASSTAGAEEGDAEAQVGSAETGTDSAPLLGGEEVDGPDAAEPAGGGADEQNPPAILTQSSGGGTVEAALDEADASGAATPPAAERELTEVSLLDAGESRESDSRPENEEGGGYLGRENPASPTSSCADAETHKRGTLCHTCKQFITGSMV